MKISDERCFMLFCNLNPVPEGFEVILQKQVPNELPYDSVAVETGSLLWVPVGTVLEISSDYNANISKNGTVMKSTSGRYGSMYGGFQPGDVVDIVNPPTDGAPGKEA